MIPHRSIFRSNLFALLLALTALYGYGQAPTAKSMRALISTNLADGTAQSRITGAKMRAVNYAMVDAIQFALDTRSAINVLDFVVGAPTTIGAAPIQAALDSATRANPDRSVYFPTRAYNTGTTSLTLSGASNIRIIGDGAVITYTGAGSALKLINCYNVDVSGITAMGTGDTQGTGYELAGCSGVKIQNCAAQRLARGVYTNLSGNITVYGPNRITGCFIDQCGRGISFEDFAEYATIENNDVYRCSDYGIFVTAGNVRTLNNTVVDNRIGIAYVGFDGTAANSDHSGIVGNTVNHNWYVGVLIQATTYSMAVNNNQIWATIGPNGQQTGYDTYDNTFGLLLRNVENINATGNTFAHNRCNVGADGYITTTFTGNTFKSDPTRTQAQFREYGAAQSTTNLNAANAFVGNTFSGLCTGGRAARFDWLGDGRSQNYDIGYNPSDAFSGAVVLSAGALDYNFTGEQVLTIQSNYAANCSVNTVLFQHKFEINYEQIVSDLTGVAIRLPGATLSSQSPAAVVGAAGGIPTVRFFQRGRYVFTPTGFSNFSVSFVPAPPFDLVPTLMNAWAPLPSSVQQPRFTRDGNGMVTLSGLVSGGASGSVIFTLPPGYRPGGNDFFAVSATSQYGTVRVETNGNVILDSAPGGFSWISLSTIRFRAVN